MISEAHNCPDCRCARVVMTNTAAAVPLTTFKVDHTIGAAAQPTIITYDFNRATAVVPFPTAQIITVKS